MEFQADAIDRVIKNTIDVMESSKYQIFEILQVARDELAALNKELQRVMDETDETLKKVDKLELQYHRFQNPADRGQPGLCPLLREGYPYCL